MIFARWRRLLLHRHWALYAVRHIVVTVEPEGSIESSEARGDWAEQSCRKSSMVL